MLILPHNAQKYKFFYASILVLYMLNDHNSSMFGIIFLCHQAHLTSFIPKQNVSLLNILGTFNDHLLPRLFLSLARFMEINPSLKDEYLHRKWKKNKHTTSSNQTKSIKECSNTRNDDLPSYNEHIIKGW